VLADREPIRQAAGRAWPLLPGHGTACSAPGIGPPGPRSVARAAGGRGRVCVCVATWRVFVILATNTAQLADLVLQLVPAVNRDLVLQLVPELADLVPAVNRDLVPGACSWWPAVDLVAWFAVRATWCLVRGPWPACLVAGAPGHAAWRYSEHPPTPGPKKRAGAQAARV
jgi:hypothetical protein